MIILRRIMKEFVTQSANRGIYLTVVMNLSHFIGIMRGFLFKVVYFKNIQSTIFAMQSSSKIEIFNKNSTITIGKFVFIRKNASFRLDHGGKLTIGDYVFINDNCVINCAEKISIGKNTKIAPNVCINDHDHNYKNIQDQHLVTGEVTIGRNVWIGANAVILRNTHIGDNSVIGAGSVVKGNIPANCLYVNEREEKIIPYNKPKVAHG